MGPSAPLRCRHALERCALQIVPCSIGQGSINHPDLGKGKLQAALIRALIALATPDQLTLRVYTEDCDSSERQITADSVQWARKTPKKRARETMSKLIEVLGDHLAAAQLDARLTRGERHLLETIRLSIEAFQAGVSLQQYEARANAEADAQEAAIAKRKLAEAKRATASRRRKGSGSRRQIVAKTKTKTPTRRAA